MKNYRWGILATGSIANSFAYDLKHLPSAEIVAVASRTQEGADQFGDEHGIATRYSNYADLANDPNVDVIYIATPHPMHAENILTCLEGGKAVLCEKPFTINAREARNVVDTARAKGLFLMEAMWTRFIPSFVYIREQLAQNALGDVQLIQADFGFKTNFDPQNRLFNKALGGGSLLDVGVYPISLSSMIWGRPEQIYGTTQIGETGVDEHNAIILDYPKGRKALLASSFRLNTSIEAWLYGTEGYMHLHSPFNKAQTITQGRIEGWEQREEETLDFSFEGNGLRFQAMHVMNCLDEGKTESDIMPLDESIEIMQTMDTLRQMWGIRYPSED